MARLAGFEPTTPWFVAKYSIQLSYSRLLKAEFYANFGPVLYAGQKKSLPWALVGHGRGGLTER